MKEGRIIKVSGPLVVAEGMFEAKMYDMVKVGNLRLVGEIIELKKDLAFIQVYEETTGLGPGEPVYLTGEPLMVELGPGLISSIYDGIQRPLDKIRKNIGDWISRGIEVPALDRERLWHFIPKVKAGDLVSPGDILGEVKETDMFIHKIMVPQGYHGRVEEIHEGDFRITDRIVKIRKEMELFELNMIQHWPVRKERPLKEKIVPNEILVTGQRIVDTLFPLAKGGTACIPGPFGSGKTVFLHVVAQWADADVIVYIGCGERGNEMADVLLEFPKLLDPRTKRPLMERTVLIANTSNMPVAAREASIYTGITIAEYFRDMGYSVAVMADSTSRWAEALREISGRLEEMPGEEGYPAYLGTRIAEFYERAGRVICLSKDSREGALSVMGAVSPPGGDLSDPVVQATLRVVKVFWGLEDKLAYKRHFPAINWLLSYSLYTENLKEDLSKNIAKEFIQMREQALKILQEEAELEEIVRLIGMEALSDEERLLLEISRSIREDFLHQNAFHEIDTYSSVKKQYYMLKVILRFYELAKESLKRKISLKEILNLKIRAEIARMKYIREDNLSEFKSIEDKLLVQFQELNVKYA